MATSTSQLSTSLPYENNYNTRLPDIQAEKGKLSFLEEEIKPLLPKHPFFNSDPSNPYDFYKKKTEGKEAVAPLSLSGQNNQDLITQRIWNNFSIFILSASLLEKQLNPQDQSSPHDLLKVSSLTIFLLHKSTYTWVY